MLIDTSILAGDVLTILDREQRAVSLEELKFRLEKPTKDIQLAVERLIRDEVAFFEIDKNRLLVKSIPREARVVHNHFTESSKRDELCLTT